MADAKSAARPRVEVGIHRSPDDRFTVVIAEGFGFDVEPPQAAALLSSWIAEGWHLFETPHGNLGRGAIIRLQKGRIVNVAQALIGIEVDGKHFRVTARDVLTPDVDEPDDWKTLQGWANAGWKLSDQTGNMFHGALLLMQRDDSADSQ